MKSTHVDSHTVEPPDDPEESDDEDEFAEPEPDPRWVRDELADAAEDQWLRSRGY